MRVDFEGDFRVQLAGTVNVYLRPEAPPSSRVSWRVRYENFIVTGDSPMAITLPIDKMAFLKVQFTDSRGNPAPIDGLVQWSSSDPTIASVHPVEPTAEDPNADKSLALLVGEQQQGSITVMATADADMGPGTKSVSATLDVEVTAGEAVAGEITQQGELVPQAPGEVVTPVRGAVAGRPGPSVTLPGQAPRSAAARLDQYGRPIR